MLGRFIKQMKGTRARHMLLSTRSVTRLLLSLGVLVGLLHVFLVHQVEVPTVLARQHSVTKLVEVVCSTLQQFGAAGIAVLT